jgi:hypothetical protein
MSKVKAIAGKTLMVLVHVFAQVVRADVLHEVHPDCASKDTIGEGIGNVAPVVWQASFDIMIHTTTWSQDSPSTPSFLIFKGV